MATGLPVLEAIAASWALVKDIVTFCKRYHDANDAIPEVFLKFENDTILLHSLHDSLSAEVLSTFDEDSLDHMQWIMSCVLPKLRSTWTRLQKYKSNTRWDRTKWAAIGTDLKEAEATMYEWVDRLQKCIILLPRPARGGLLTSMRVSESQISAVIAQRDMENRIVQFQQLTQSEHARLVEDYRIDLHSSIAPWSGGRLEKFDQNEYLIEWKRLPAARAGDFQSKKDAENELLKLISVLSAIDAEKMHCMRAVKYFVSQYEASVPFGVFYELPARFKAPISLAQLLEQVDNRGNRILKHPLDQRFELVRQIGSALLFVHSVGWVHKGIHPSNIWLAERKTSAEVYPEQLGTAFVAGFDYTRRDVAISTGDETAGLNWHRKIYQHPSREAVEDVPESHAPFDTVHDIYALGVVMVEVGRWKPLHSYPESFRRVSASTRKQNLERMAQSLKVTMGRRYVSIALRCLSAADQEQDKEERRTAIRDILISLEDLSSAMTA